ncbi:member of major facilitator superfamily multidrug-resistance, DHA1 sub-family [Gymnopus androsaceus JB14]|uniref:Member of major facilitator superfamily multidrug-resistance, DHA1 sub-family n=1 Tax=Gymnopus androsaceus JB14 TaxID=1447944 RepID=A0A6A4HTH5_9AGAR|nr:member of major facilitator superfamily multidrug-resistance, DHA1 sub-family [Gymnopus androsaceus JB14]
MSQVDEETPLLREQQCKPQRTPLPWFQFTLVLFLQLSEPLTSQVIYPFLPQLIRDIGITGGDETKVGYYVGLLQSLFFLTQALTVLHWSRISDRVGRKPVVLIGLFGLSMSMYCFGLSRTFWGLVLSRSLSGALNGNIGVIKSIMADMTDATNISQAYAYFPIAWSTGGVLGVSYNRLIGGGLANPTRQYPHLFGDNEFLKKYPYFLPCAVPATVSAIAWLVTFMFLKETVQAPTLSLPRLFRSKKPTSLSAASDINDVPIEIPDTERPLGGLGLEPSSIGNILSIFGLLNGLLQIFFFAKINDHWGSKKTIIVGIVSTLPMFLCFPILTYLVKSNGSVTPLAWVIVGVQTILSLTNSFSFGAIFIYITAASPNRASLGATNGLSQMMVSVCRAIGPAASNSLFSLSLRHQYLAGLSLLTASMLPKKV